MKKNGREEEMEERRGRGKRKRERRRRGRGEKKKNMYKTRERNGQLTHPKQDIEGHEHRLHAGHEGASGLPLLAHPAGLPPCLCIAPFRPATRPARVREEEDYEEEEEGEE